MSLCHPASPLPSPTTRASSLRAHCSPWLMEGENLESRGRACRSWSYRLRFVNWRAAVRQTMRNRTISGQSFRGTQVGKTTQASWSHHARSARSQRLWRPPALGTRSRQARPAFEPPRLRAEHFGQLVGTAPATYRRAVRAPRGVPYAERSPRPVTTLWAPDRTPPIAGGIRDCEI